MHDDASRSKATRRVHLFGGRAGGAFVRWAARGGGVSIFYAYGPLLDDETVIGTPSDIVDALIQMQLSGIGSSDRPTARRAIAIAVAQELQELQEFILEAAAKAGRLSSTSVTDPELARLRRSKAIPDDFSQWLSAVRLILVAPEAPWVYPGGQMIVIDPTSDATLVISLLLTMWLWVERLG